MAKNRMINTRFWDDTYTSELDPIEKLLFLYFLTNTSTNICGFYEIPLKKIASETGIDKDMVLKIIQRFSEDQKIFYIEGWVYIKNFVKHQNQQSPKIKRGIEIEMENIPKNIAQIAKEIGYTYGIDTLSHSNTNSNLNSNKEKQVSQFLSPTISQKKRYNKNMKKNSFKHNENMHQDEFEVSVDYDTREEINPEPKKKVRKDADVINLRNAFIEICEQEIGVKPIKDAKGYMAVKNALQHIEYNDVIDMYERWFKQSGRPKEDLIAVTKCLSNNELNKFRLQKEQG